MTAHEPPRQARTRFFDSALRVCANRGYHRTRMEDIAREAERSKGALYHHFSSKRALFVALCKDVVERFSASVDAGMQAPTTAGALLERVVVGAGEDAAADLFRVFVELMPEAMRDEELREPLEHYYEQAIESLAAVISWGRDRGEIRRDVDPRTIARIIAMGGDGMYLVGTALGDTARARKDVGEMVQRVMAGIAAP